MKHRALAITVAFALITALAVPAHAAEKADDDAFILGCAWAGDRHHNDARICGGFPTRALCEREGRAAVASGELSKFECISTAELAALLEAIGHIFADQPTAAGPGGSDEPTFGRQMPAPDPGFDWRRKFVPRTAASAPQTAGANQPAFPPNWQAAPPPGWHLSPSGFPVRDLPPPTTAPQSAGIPPGWTEMRTPGQRWADFMRNAKPSLNVEDFRKR